MNDSKVLLWLESITGSGSWASAVVTVLFLAFGLFVVGTVVRMFRGKGSDLCQAVAGVLTVILVYLTAATASASLPVLASRLDTLPFCSFSGVYFSLLPVSGVGLYGGLLRLWLLAFLVDLLEAFLPKGKKFGGWLLWRSVSVLLAISVYSFLTDLLEAGCPALFSSMAQAVLAVCWGLVLLIGLIRALLSVIQSSGNPLVNFLHRFFYSNQFGKLFPMSILTTVLLVALSALLRYWGIGAFSLTFWSYIPTVAILLGFLYLFGRFL